MDDVLSSDEACKYLKMSKITLLKYVELGKIPGIKMGRRWKFSRKLLSEWLIERTKQDTDARFKAHLRRISAIK